MNENVGSRAPAFDGSVILFQNIIEALRWSMPAILLQSALGFEPLDGRWITGVLIGIDYARRRMVLSAQGFGEKALNRCCVAFSREKEVDRRSAGVERATTFKRCAARSVACPRSSGTATDS
jgi:hypothetical protein